ncbi:MAG: response regulator transcription factor [Anaerolineae bacterium]
MALKSERNVRNPKWAIEFVVEIRDVDTINVLVADDHSLFRHEVVTALERDPGITVVGQADSATTALDRAQELLPTVVLLDINMPGNGLQAARSIAQTCPTSKIVMLTVEDDASTVLAALEAGASGYLLKGMTGDDLVSAIRLVVQGNLMVVPAIAVGMLMGGEKNSGSM